MTPLTTKDKALLYATVLTNPYIPVKPTRKQAEFLACPSKEAFYGGAAGGGKSFALLMAALQYVVYPQYSALLLRRTFPELSQRNGLMDIARQWLSGTDAKPSDQGRVWTFPSEATLAFGYLENENDKYRYQGSEYQFIGFDELSQFTDSQYTYLFSRLRRSVDNPVPERMRAASNPGGAGHQWVKERFVEPTEIGTGRIFIPSKLRENPYLDQESYIANLGNLDPVTRAQYLDGDWNVQAAGNLFKRHWFQVVDGCPGLTRKLRYWDMAGTTDGDYTVGALVGLYQGVYYIIDIQRIRETPGQVEALIKQTAELDGRAIPVRTEEEGGSAGLMVTHHYATQVLVGWDYKGIRPTGDKVTRAGPFSSASEKGNVKIVRGAWNNAFLDELTLFPEGGHDDQVDAASGAIGELSAGDASRFLVTRVGKMRS